MQSGCTGYQNVMVFGPLVNMHSQIFYFKFLYYEIHIIINLGFGFVGSCLSLVTNLEGSMM